MEWGWEYRFRGGHIREDCLHPGGCQPVHPVLWWGFGEQCPLLDYQPDVRNPSASSGKSLALRFTAVPFCMYILQMWLTGQSFVFYSAFETQPFFFLTLWAHLNTLNGGTSHMESVSIPVSRLSDSHTVALWFRSIEPGSLAQTLGCTIPKSANRFQFCLTLFPPSLNDCLWRPAISTSLHVRFPTHHAPAPSKKRLQAYARRPNTHFLTFPFYIMGSLRIMLGGHKWEECSQVLNPNAQLFLRTDLKSFFGRTAGG